MQWFFGCMMYKESALGKWKSDKFGENFVQEPAGDIIKFEIQCKFWIIGNFKIVLGRSFQIEDLQTATVFLWHNIGGTLGRCANNQNGNLRWYLPWRGGLEGVSSATYLFWKMIFLKTI